MNESEKTLARILFKNKIHAANGQAFEDIFTQIMNYAEPDFTQIKPWGNIGDRKNDGYIKSKGIFFQVFAPEDINKSYPDSIKKLEHDFIGLKKVWSPVKEYYFVVNDKYNGPNPDCERAIQQLKKAHKLENAGIKTAKDLENLLFKLSDDQILSITGFLPSPENITQLDYSVLNEVMSHIMKLPLHNTADDNIVCPNWDNKINFNELDDLCAKYLSHGFLQVKNLDIYLENESTFFAEELKKKIRSIYTDKKRFASGSRLFFEIMNAISPKSESMYQVAAIVIIAKYFETCDIFEEPQ